MQKINVVKFKEMLTSGKTLNEIAVEFNTTKQNVSLWRKHWFPTMTKKEYGCGVRTLIKLNSKVRGNMKHSDSISQAKSMFFSRKKQNAKNKKWDFSIEYHDIVWNDVCPILGIKINWENEIRGEDSPSLDRIDSSKGYIPGNVAICSWRANRIKNDGTEEEHRKIADYLHSLLQDT